MKCKICRGNTLTQCGQPRIDKRFSAHDFKKYTIVQCTSCGFYFISPNINLDQNQWSKIYQDNYFVTTLSRWRIKLQERETKERLDYLESNCQKGGITSFLDMGCGEGFALKIALEKGWSAYGLDIADNLTREIGRDKINYFCGNLFDAKYPDDHFDVIYMDSVLEHIDYPMDTLNELLRILKPGGQFFTIVPNEDCLENMMKKIVYTCAFKKELYGIIKPFYPPYHINGFNKNSISKALELTGFTLKDVKTFGSSYPFWRGFKRLSPSYFKALLLYPIGLCSTLLNRQIQLQVLSVKPNES